MPLSTTSQKIQINNYIPQLDGLRGIAILIVLCFHYFPNTYLFRFGWSGVDLFFVLSGYLITGRLLPFLSDKKLLQKFYWNRFIRIVPLYFGFLLLFFTCWFLFATQQTLTSYKYYQNHWWAFFLFFQNWTFILNSPSSPGGLTHLWSLAVEEQFYIIFPLFILAIKQRKKLLFAAISLIFLIVISRCLFFNLINLNGQYEKIHCNTFFRLDSFFVGLILFIITEKKMAFSNITNTLKLLSFTSIAILFFYVIVFQQVNANSVFYLTIGYTIVAITYAVLIFASVLNKNKILKKITNNPFLKYSGKISYSIFIIHYPLYTIGLGFLNWIVHHYHVNISSNSLLIINGLCCFPLTYLASHLSFKYYESYFLKWKIKLLATQ